MPILLVTGLIVLVRVMTLGTPNPALPERSVINGLGHHKTSGSANRC